MARRSPRYLRRAADARESPTGTVTETASVATGAMRGFPSTSRAAVVRDVPLEHRQGTRRPQGGRALSAGLPSSTTTSSASPQRGGVVERAVAHGQPSVVEGRRELGQSRAQVHFAGAFHVQAVVQVHRYRQLVCAALDAPPTADDDDLPDGTEIRPGGLLFAGDGGDGERRRASPARPARERGERHRSCPRRCTSSTTRRSDSAHLPLEVETDCAP